MGRAPCGWADAVWLKSVAAAAAPATTPTPWMKSRRSMLSVMPGSPLWCAIWSRHLWILILPAHRSGAAAPVCCRRNVIGSLFGRRYRVVVEVDVAVRLRPETDAAADRRRPLVLERELAVEIAFDLLAVDLDLEIVPGARRRRRIA